MFEELEELAGLPELPTQFHLYLETCIIACSFLASHDLLIIHQLLTMLQEEEDRIQAANRDKAPANSSQDSKTPEDSSPRELLSPAGIIGSNFLLPPSSPHVTEESSPAREDEEFAVKMLVLAIAMVAAGESVNVAMVSRSLELLLVHGSHAAMEMVLLAFALLHPSEASLSIVDQMMRKTAGGGLTNVGLCVNDEE